MTVSELLRYMAQKIDTVTEDAAFEARELVALVTGIPAGELFMHRPDEAAPGTPEKLDALIARRLAREPLQYILGEWSFYGLPFITRPGALIPRQDTETLVEQALCLLKDKPAAQVLDLCCGTGCIGITLAKFANAQVTFSDISEKCIALAKENAEKNNVQGTFVCADLFSGVTGRQFDMIVCNPPYLTVDEMLQLQPEVRFEPESALSGGETGLDFYRRIANDCTRFLKPGGALLMEIGCGQGRQVQEMFPGSQVIPDINGKDRVVQVIV